MKNRNELRTTVSLKENLYLKQNLYQLMTILQYPILDLRELIESRWEENPFIELEDNRFDSILDIEDFDDEDRGNYQLFESLIKEEKTLKDYLEEQIILFNFNEEEKNIAHHLIGNIDDNGFLNISIDLISNQIKKNKKEVEKVLEILKNEIHPPGVFAKNIKECIIIQLLRDNEIDKKDIEKYENIIDKLLKGEKIEEEYYKKLEKVYIYPSHILEKSINMYITPEVFLKIEDKELRVYYNDKIFPKVKFNENLYNDIKSRIFELTKEEKEFFKNRVKDAKDLIFLILERQEKVLKVAEYLVNKQKDFFLNSGYLNVLTLKEISNDLNLSISTLSRIVNEKYIDTPKGILPFKFLLGKEGVKKGVFGTKVKMLIKDIIDNEDKKKPYSDSEIVKILIKKGVYLKRRTIAKYREELNIPSKNERRRK
ncbi:MAG: RNA polymerase factor sigma-54 [Caldisericia bacterium]